jgi:hypothetical protein
LKYQSNQLILSGQLILTIMNFAGFFCQRAGRYSEIQTYFAAPPQTWSVPQRQISHHAKASLGPLAECSVMLFIQ